MIRLTPWLLCSTVLFAVEGFGQVKPVFPGVGTESQSDDLEEVEEVVGDEEFLPAYSGSSEASVKEAGILEQQVTELSLSHEELRRGFEFGSSLALGGTDPWLNYSVSMFHLVDPSWNVGIALGSGGITDSGRVEERHYDIRIESRGLFATSRYYIDVLQPLSVEATFGFVSVNGNVDPSGSDDLLPDEKEKLRSAYEANLLATGIAVSIDAQWDNGVFFEWTPIATRKSWVISKSLARESDTAEKAIVRKLERPGIYGLVNVKLGYYF